jgi:hypothetical protein
VGDFYGVGGKANLVMTRRDSASSRTLYIFRKSATRVAVVKNRGVGAAYGIAAGLAAVVAVAT